MARELVTSAIIHRIFLIRGQSVLLDRDIAEIYGVETKYLNRQVKRNSARFPQEFMFRLTKKEKNELVTNWHRFDPIKHASTLPFAFTEYGVVMLASVLNSEQAVKASILIAQTFVRLREITRKNKDFERKLNALEGKVANQDEDIKLLFETIRKLFSENEKPRPRIGYLKEKAARYKKRQVAENLN